MKINGYIYLDDIKVPFVIVKRERNGRKLIALKEAVEELGFRMNHVMYIEKEDDGWIQWC